VSLDFNRPSNAIVRGAYLTYLTIVGSLLGLVLHGDPDTYRYIPESIRKYPGAHGVAARMEQLGFDQVRAIPVLAGLHDDPHANKRQSLANEPRCSRKPRVYSSLRGFVTPVISGRSTVAARASRTPATLPR
jgi:hypothetical protein